MWGCKTQKNVLEINFGSSGGFTGQVTKYHLTSDGKLTEIDKDKSETIKEIHRKQTKRIFELAEELRTYQLNSPGNMSSFIEIKSKQNTNSIVWSLGATDVDSKITQLYSELMSLIKKSDSNEKQLH